MTFENGKYKIEIVNDRFYSPNSPNNQREYQFQYHVGKMNTNRLFTINKRGITLQEKDSNKVLSSAILCENGGKTEVSKEIFQIQNDKFWMLVGDKIYCLQIPSLELFFWKTIDLGTIYSIHKFQNDFVIYGELGVNRLTTEGENIWEFKGSKGIFLPTKDCLIIRENTIELIDGNEEKFVLNEFGKVIS